MPPTDDLKCNAAYLTYCVQMRVVWLVGGVAVGLSLSLGIALVGMVVMLVQTGKPEIAVVVAMFGTVQSIVTGAIGLLAPSPLQGQQRQGNQRAGDSGVQEPVPVTVTNTESQAVPVEETPPRQESEAG